MDNRSTTLFVALPTATGSVRAETLGSLVRLINALGAHDIKVTFASLSYAEVAVSRNALVDDFLETDLSHCLFIDDCTAFEPQVIGDMLSANRPFVGAFTARRHLDLKRFATAYAQAEKAGADDPVATALAHGNDFLGLPRRPARHRIVEADQVDASLLMLRRDVFATLDEADDTIPDVLHPRTGKSIRGYFDRVYLESERAYLSEDRSLCYRWRRRANQKIFAFAGRGITHYGDFAYRAALSDL